MDNFSQLVRKHFEFTWRICEEGREPTDDEKKVIIEMEMDILTRLPPPYHDMSLPN